MAKVHFKPYLDEEIVTRLSEAAEKFSRRSPNEVATEVLERYLKFWESTEEAKLAVFEQQRAGLIETGDVYMKGRGSKGEIERVVKDASTRERAKKGRK